MKTEQGPIEPEPAYVDIDDEVSRKINRDIDKTLSWAKVVVAYSGEYDQGDLVTLFYDDFADLVAVAEIVVDRVRESDR